VLCVWNEKVKARVGIHTGNVYRLLTSRSRRVLKVDVMNLHYILKLNCGNIAGAAEAAINQWESECMEIEQMKLSAYYFGG